ncbi:MAG: hypothetical protein B6243_05700 [Anaerolineaceae bacterium 4572_5.2]|nr:MAG: hypothetical protein B6243_05700 [Anaerolineaceae bacterium 4572_5.2]
MTITLSQLIDEVREELLTPRRAHTKEAMYPFLFVEEIELEVGVTVSSAVEGSGGIDIQVVELGASVEKTNEQAHRIKIKMTPLLSKEEVRTKLKNDKRTWQKMEDAIIPAVTKEDGMVGDW